MKTSSISSNFNPGITSPDYLMRGNLLKAIKSQVPNLQGKMLDFGCGSKPYKSLFNVSEYIGVDFEGQGHSHENEQIDFFYDGEKLPFPDNYFDSVFSTEVFEHVFNLEDIMKELYRVLKPDGKILITCPFAIAEHEIPNDYARYTSFGLQHLFQKNNFTILHFEKTGSNFQTVMHFNIMYYEMAIMGKLAKFKTLKQICSTVGNTLLNSFTKVILPLMPKRNDLYLNNVLLAKKN